MKVKDEKKCFIDKLYPKINSLTSQVSRIASYLTFGGDAKKSVGTANSLHKLSEDLDEADVNGAIDQAATLLLVSPFHGMM